MQLISKTLTCAYFPAIVQYFRYVLIQVSNYTESLHIGKAFKYSLELEGIGSDWEHRSNTLYVYCHVDLSQTGNSVKENLEHWLNVVFF